jgi:hypothetical protein
VFYCDYPRISNFKCFADMRHGHVQLSSSGSGYRHSDRRYVPPCGAIHKLCKHGLSIYNLAPVGIY